MSPLEVRVRRLEWTIRALSLALGGLVLTGGFAMLAGAAQTPRAVEAHRFILKNNQGDIVAILGLDEDNSPALLMMNRTAKPFTGAVGLTPSQLEFTSTNNKSRLKLYGGDPGTVGISLRDEDGKLRLSLETNKEFGSSLLFSDAEESSRLQMTLSGSNDARLNYRPRNSRNYVEVIPAKDP